MKYNVGDEVKIREDLVEGETYESNAYVVRNMMKYAGMQAKIMRVIEISRTYELSLDSGFWNWPEGALLPYPIEDGGKTYEDGLDEAWSLAKKIFADMSEHDLDKIFGKDWSFPKLMRLSPQEAAEKIKAWEDAKEIHVGDVVKDITRAGDEIAVVTYIDAGQTCHVLWNDGSGGEFNKNDFIKTGRTIDIAGLLEQIGGQ